MTEIILARHGETAWNAAEIFRGRSDVELNDTGLKQAELLAEYLSGVRIEAVYSSPMKRALQTAETIAGCGKLGVNIAPGLIDFNYGRWQGLSQREVKERYKELYAEWVSRPERVKMPDGESLDDVSERAVAVVDDVVNKYQGTVVLVSHRVVNKVLICALLGLDNSHFWSIKLDMCGITVFAFAKGQVILTRHNDTSFLKSIHGPALGDF